MTSKCGWVLRRLGVLFYMQRQADCPCRASPPEVRVRNMNACKAVSRGQSMVRNATKVVLQRCNSEDPCGKYLCFY